MSDEKNSSPIMLVPVLIMLCALLVSSGSHRSYGGFTPPPPRPRIASIPADDPAILGFKAFADKNNLEWQVTPDSLDGTSYCAVLSTRSFKDPRPYRNGIGCRDTIAQATNEAMAEWNQGGIKVGNR